MLQKYNNNQFLFLRGSVNFVLLKIFLDSVADAVACPIRRAVVDEPDRSAAERAGRQVGHSTYPPRKMSKIGRAHV